MSAADAPVQAPATAGWPWPRLSPAWCGLLHSIVELLPGHTLLGWEASVRLGAGGIDAGRLLVGLAPGADEAALAALPARLGAPAAAARAFADGLAGCDQVFLAAEQDAQGVIAKAYLQWPLPLTDGRPSPRLQMRGWKWRLQPAAVAGSALAPPLRTTDYLRWPVAGPAEALALLRAGRGAAADARPALALAADALALALASGGRRGFEPGLLLVHEPGSPRASCALRLLDSGLQAGALRAGIEQLAALWRLDASTAAACLAAITRRELSWLAAGTDHRGQGFLTLYAAADLAEVSQAMQAQAGPASGTASLLHCAP